MSYALTVRSNAAITLSSTGVVGGTTSTLRSWPSLDHRSTGAVPAINRKHPFQVPISNTSYLSLALSGELVVSGCVNSSSQTYVCHPRCRLLEFWTRSFFYDGNWSHLRGRAGLDQVWAPTAKIREAATGLIPLAK